MTKRKWSNLAWGAIVLCFVVLVIIGHFKIKEQNEVLSQIPTRKDVQSNEKQDTININDEDKNLKGSILAVEENYILVVDEAKNRHEVYQKEFLNGRTRDKMDISTVSPSDYYKNGEIIRNISDEELRQELLLNLARCFNSSKLSTEVIRLKRLEKHEGYVTFKVKFYDGNYALFGKESPKLFNLELMATEDTVLYARNNIVSIYNLQRVVRDKIVSLGRQNVFYLGLDENTLKNERAFVTDFEIVE